MKIRRGSFTKNAIARKTKKLYARFYDHNAVRRNLPLFQDEKNSAEAARAIERLVNIRASGSDLPPELQRFIENTLPTIRNKIAEWGIIDSTRVAAVKTLAEHTCDWKTFLLSKGNGAEYVELKTLRLNKLFKACGFVMWNDIRATVMSETLAAWRARKAASLSVQTSNFYLQAAKQFCNYMMKIKKCATTSPLSELSAQNVKIDRRHDRRAYLVDEFCRLLHYLQTAEASWNIVAAERALIYQFAAETGLRRGAIAALRVRSFGRHDGSPAVLVPAGAPNKYKHERWVLLRESMWTLLEAHFVGKMSVDDAFKMPPKGHTAKMIRKDLDAARAQWIAEAEGDGQRQQRESSNFLRYCDDRGLYLDFHAFRHTRGVWLFEHHNAKPREVQELLGVGSMALVDRYTRSMKITNNAVIERGPSLVPQGPNHDDKAAGNDKSHETDEEKSKIAVKSSTPSLSQRAGFRRISTDLDGRDGHLPAGEQSGANSSKLPGKTVSLTPVEDSDMLPFQFGEVAERLNAPVSKTG